MSYVAHLYLYCEMLSLIKVINEYLQTTHIFSKGDNWKYKKTRKRSEFWWKYLKKFDYNLIWIIYASNSYTKLLRIRTNDT